MLKLKKLIPIILFANTLIGCSGHRLTNQDGISIPVIVESYPVDQKKTAPTVVIAHGSDGVQMFHRDWARLVQSWGYNAVIVDHYSLRGISIHTGVVLEGARGEDRARDLVAVSHWINLQPWHQGKMAVIGFSQGGAGVFALVGKQEDVEYFKIVKNGQSILYTAAVAFYPGCSITPPPIKPTIPTQVHLAADDTLAMIGFCVPLNDPKYEVYKYEGATHAFDVYLSAYARPIFYHRYDSMIAQQSQKNTRKFLDQQLR
jgi:dienelactone hydrolase